jgi:hypothetical protein
MCLNDRWLHSFGRRDIADQLDDPYDHDRYGIQFDCNERFRELCLSRIADWKRQRLLQTNLCPTTSSSLEILWP